MATNLFAYGRGSAQSAQSDEAFATDRFNRVDAKFEKGLFKEAIAKFDGALHLVPEHLKFIALGENSKAAWKGMQRGLQF